ncbi:MAG: hypothetical protein RJA61_712 [Candidatus Parcubacteria bacterium]|jgi:MFS family permease
MTITPRRSLGLGAVYLGNLLLAFHWYTILYVNSSFISTLVGEEKVGLIYTIGSFLNLLLLLLTPRILKRFGNYKFIVSVIVIEALATLGLALIGYTTLALILFIIHQALVPLILFGLDVFLEEYSPNESTTGSTRGVFLTLANLALVISPALAGLVLTNGDYWKIYLLSTIFLVPILGISSVWRSNKKTIIENTSILNTFRRLRKNKDIFLIWKANFILQMFYAFMVIYLPIYLHEYIGFEWSHIGSILTIMFLPFLLFEFPIGRLADKKLGEKEILGTGFVIAGLSTALIAFIEVPLFALWALILFTTRVGASFIEITSESYFFKHVKTTDTDLVSFFRITRPLSFIIAPLIASLLLPYITYGTLFGIVGVMMLFGLQYSLRIQDTK